MDFGRYGCKRPCNFHVGEGAPTGEILWYATKVTKCVTETCFVRREWDHDPWVDYPIGERPHVGKWWDFSPDGFAKHGLAGQHQCHPEWLATGEPWPNDLPNTVYNPNGIPICCGLRQVSVALPVSVGLSVGVRYSVTVSVALPISVGLSIGVTYRPPVPAALPVSVGLNVGVGYAGPIAVTLPVNVGLSMDVSFVGELSHDCAGAPDLVPGHVYDVDGATYVVGGAWGRFAVPAGVFFHITATILGPAGDSIQIYTGPCSGLVLLDTLIAPGCFDASFLVDTVVVIGLTFDPITPGTPQFTIDFGPC